MIKDRLKYLLLMTGFLLGVCINGNVLASVNADGDPEVLKGDVEVVEGDEEGDDEGDEEGDEVTVVSEGEDDGESTDEEPEVYEEDEIVVTGKDGKEEIIEVPEGLVIDEDAESSDFNRRNYLEEDSTALMPNVIPVFEQQVYEAHAYSHRDALESRGAEVHRPL